MEMSSFVNRLLLFLLVPLSMHACSARSLGIVDHKSLASVQQGVRDINTESKLQESSVLKMHEARNGGTSGHHVILSQPCHGDLEKASKKDQGLKRQARMMLRKATQYSEETMDDSKEKGAVEDVVAMDYAQPQKKAPIHN